MTSYNGNTYTWINGRQLSKIQSINKTINYKYNDSGIRTQKEVNGEITKYHVDGNKIIYEVNKNGILHYKYDEKGNLIGFDLNNENYYYLRNGQGDIIEILDNNLNNVISYTYDTWGKIVKITNNENVDVTEDMTSIGNINAYRYRGYYYDTETKMYYLQSRYYMPEFGRFINADEIVGVMGQLISNNMFIYCLNNPVNMIDETGHFPKLNFYGNYFTINNNSSNSSLAAKGSNVVKKVSNSGQPPPETGYVPPKSKSPIKKTTPAPGSKSGETGYLDKKGNVWVPDNGMHGGEGWRVHFPNGNHKHVYPDGNERTHNYSNVNAGDIITIGTGLAVAYGVYTTVKWTVAIFATPFTSGGSLGIAIITP